MLLLLLQNHIKRAHVAIVLRLRAGSLARVARVAGRLLATVVLEHGNGFNLRSCPGRDDFFEWHGCQVLRILVEAFGCNLAFRILIRIFATRDAEWIYIRLLICAISEVCSYFK